MEVGARQSKKCLSGTNCFLWTVLLGSGNYFLMKASDTSMIKPCISKQKLSYLKKMTLLAFFFSISTTRVTLTYRAKNITYLLYFICVRFTY